MRFDLPTSGDVLLLDTSAALALVSPDHVAHQAVRARVRGYRLGLAGHARVETYSVLTRLPPPRRLSPAIARQLIDTNFPVRVTLPISEQEQLLEAFERAGIAGGAVYDALVALAATQFTPPGDEAVPAPPLLTLDRRAIPTYQALGTVVELLPQPR